MQEQETRRLELKVCERCGGLWLRPAMSGWVYCVRCKGQVDELPKVKARVTRKRRKSEEEAAPANAVAAAAAMPAEGGIR